MLRRWVSICLVTLLPAGVAIAQQSLAMVIPVAGSTPGNFGSYFRTAIQLRNVGSFVSPGGPVAGRFVFHPAGAVGSPSDPSLPFTIGEGATLSYDDIVQSMGQTGLGSLDIELPENFDPSSPHTNVIAVVRVFNDGGTNGTSGFTERAGLICRNNFGTVFCWPEIIGFLVAPADPTRFRFNIGIRTLDKGATLRFTVNDATGSRVHQVTKSFPPNYFLQQSADALLEIPLLASYSIEVYPVSPGSAAVYGATTDNTTNDSSIQSLIVRRG